MNLAADVAAKKVYKRVALGRDEDDAGGAKTGGKINNSERFRELTTISAALGFDRYEATKESPSYEQLITYENEICGSYSGSPVCLHVDPAKRHGDRVLDRRG